jgi:hypothetical protein
MALLNMPEGFIDPSNNYDDVIATSLPIAAGTVASGAVTWSFFGNQPASASSSIVVSITNPATNQFVINPGFTASLSPYANAPATGLVVVEVYRAHPQVTKLFNILSGLAGGGRSFIPDPIPIHTYTVFPLAAVEPH